MTATTFPSTTCRSCGARIIWCQTAKSKQMPVDADPSPDGNVEIFEAAGVLRAAVVTSPSLFTTPRHTSHFATCPDASRWRAAR